MLECHSCGNCIQKEDYEILKDGQGESEYSRYFVTKNGILCWECGHW